MTPPAAILLDIEGTVAPISFVHDSLFPFARARLGAFLAAHSTDREIAGALAELEDIAPGSQPVQTLHALMDHDSKIGPLKFIQGRIWAEGYASGALTSAFYPEVATTLQTWHASGLRLAIYSSGSEQAQKLLFGHAAVGDLTPLFTGFYDTRVGAKRDAASYAAIARDLAEQPGRILFLSDIEAELDAASKAGLVVCQIVRPEDGTVASTRHPHEADLTGIARRFSLTQPQ